MTDPALIAKLTASLATARRALAEADDALRDMAQAAGTPALIASIAAATEGRWATSGEIWRLAQAQAEAAMAEGDPEPELMTELRRAGIGNAYALGRWLSAHEGRGIERGPAERDGVVWLAVST